MQKIYGLIVYLSLFLSLPIQAAFTPPVTISPPLTTPTFAQIPQMAQDPSGNIIAVWQQLLPGNLQTIVAAKHSPLGEWQTPFFAIPPTTFINNFQISIDDAGNAYLIWVEGVPFNTMSVFTAFLPAGSQTWSPPILLSTSANIDSPNIAASVPGRAVATWGEAQIPNQTVQFASVFEGGIWTPPIAISNPVQNAINGELAIDGAGRAVAIWQIDQINIQAAWLVGNTWTIPQVISNISNGAADPQISMNSSGQAVAVWERLINVNQTVIDTAFFSEGIWSPPLTLTPLSEQAVNPVVGIDAFGQAVAAWQVVLSGGNNEIQGAYTVGGLWSSPVRISLVGDNSIEPVISVNFFGRAAVSWVGTINNCTCITEVSLFDGTTFSTPVSLSDPNFLSILQNVLVDNAGNVVLVWQAINLNSPEFLIQSSQTDNVFPPFPPLNFKGIVKKNVFLTQTEKTHVLTWSPRIDINVAGYILYRNGQFLTFVSAAGPLIFIDHDRSKNDVYSIVSFTTTGLVSAPVTIFVTK